MEFLLVLLTYFIPTIISFCRKQERKWAIFWLNLLFGWSIIGWWIAFFKALGSKGNNVQVNVNVSNVQNNGGAQ